MAYIRNGGFNGRLSMDDANGSVQIDGNFNVAKTIPDFNLKASVRTAPSRPPSVGQI